MSEPAFVVGTMYGMFRVAGAYVEIFKCDDSMKVRNPNGPTYPFKITSVTFVKDTSDRVHIHLNTKEKCIFFRAGVEDHCYELDRTFYDPVFFTIEFLHSCDFTLEIEQEGEKRTITPIAGDVNNFSLSVLFKKPQKNSPAPNLTDMCVIV